MATGASASRRTIAYVRVSSQDQLDDLEQQKQIIQLYCARQGWTFEVVADVGSGVDCDKKGLKYLIETIITDRSGGS